MEIPSLQPALRRYLPDRGNAVLDEESLGINGKSYLAYFAGVLPRHVLQGSLDALGLYCHPETRRSTAHLDRDPYHFPTPTFRVRSR
jgi:hypothetical protein